MKFQFETENSLSNRIKLFNANISGNNTKVPVIIEKGPDCKIDKIIKRNYLFDKQLKMGEINRMIRKNLNLDNSQSLTFLAQGKYTIPPHETIGEIYNKYKNKDDNFLYIAYVDVLFFG